MAAPFLVAHYIRHIWSMPSQDNPSIIRLENISPVEGYRNFITVMSERYRLPTLHDRYFLYQLGNIKEHLLNLPVLEWEDTSTWVNMADYVRDCTIAFSFYTKTGKYIPLSLVYFTRTISNNLIFVIKEETGLGIDFNKLEVTFKTYKNALITTRDASLRKEKIDVIYQKVKDARDKNRLLAFVNDYAKKTGVLTAYVNGYWVKDIMGINLVEDDIVEVVYDSTIAKVITMRLGSTPTFKSTLDQIRKYIFSYDKTTGRDDVEFYDDCEFFLIAAPRQTPLLQRGVILHRNDITNIRQLANRDFSISTNLVRELMESNPILDPKANEVYFYVQYRKQYKTRKMPYVNNRIHELNRLNYSDRLAAMRGLKSNVDAWKAENLENSMAIKMMSLEHPTCRLTDAEQAYGYNAAVWYTAKSVHPHSSFIDGKNGAKYLTVPYAYRQQCTAYEYDREGKLLSWGRYAGMNEYTIVNKDQCFAVEFIGGVGTVQPYQYYGNAGHEFEYSTDDQRYKIYSATDDDIRLKPNDPKIWSDVTALVQTTSRETLTNKYLTIQPTNTARFNTADRKFIIRTDREYLSVNTKVETYRGNLKFTLMQSYYDVTDRRVKNQPVKIPYGYLDIFLNGYALIEGIDYFVDFPEVHIINKSAINPNIDMQVITYRLYGFPNETTLNGKKVLSGVVNADRQVGYVRNHQLSRNNHFDLLDDKNLLIKVGSGVIPKEKLGFGEHGSKTIERANILEGKPYEIMEIIPPKRDIFTQDTDTFKNAANIIDKQVTDYLSQVPYLRDKPMTETIPLQEKYKIFSPLVSRLIDDLSRNMVTFPKMNLRYTDDEVIDYIEANYREFFNIEPLFNLEYIDRQYVTILPTFKDHVTTLSYHANRFLRAVIRIYLKDEIETSHFIRVGN